MMLASVDAEEAQAVKQAAAETSATEPAAVGARSTE